jgi:hypothetical protein
MTSRIYSVSFAAVAVTAAVDLFELTPADDKPIEIIGIFLGQSSDSGDAQAEALPFRVIRGHTTSGSGGGTATPRPCDRSGPAAGFTVETNNTTAASAGTGVDLWADVWPLQSGYPLLLPDGCGLEASQGDTTLVVRLGAAPADSITVSATLLIKEQG